MLSVSKQHVRSWVKFVSQVLRWVGFYRVEVSFLCLPWFLVIKILGSFFLYRIVVKKVTLTGNSLSVWTVVFEKVVSGTTRSSVAVFVATLAS